MMKGHIWNENKINTFSKSIRLFHLIFDVALYTVIMFHNVMKNMYKKKKKKSFVKTEDVVRNVGLYLDAELFQINLKETSTWPY